MILKDIPFEVQEVWAYSWLNSPVGAETYKRLQETIDKYPEYFEWEHKYKDIPQEVHSKYEEERINMYFSFYPPKESDMKEGEGIAAYVKRRSEEPVTALKTEDLVESLKYIFETAPKIKREYETAKKKLWNKHYSKYKLKYRE